MIKPCNTDSDHVWVHRDGDWFYCEFCLTHAIVRSETNKHGDFEITVEICKVKN